MNYQQMKDERTKRPQKISLALRKITKKFTSKRNKREFIIHSKWDEIVGDFFAEHTDPVRVENIKNHNNEFEENSYEGALHINIVGPAALEFEYFKDKIIEKINSFFGYMAISKIVLHQVPYLEKTGRVTKIKKNKKVLSKDQALNIKKTVVGIKNKELEKTLFKLGKSILMDKD